jgi:hypothetical protein
MAQVMQEASIVKAINDEDNGEPDEDKNFTSKAIRRPHFKASSESDLMSDPGYDSSN